MLFAAFLYKATLMCSQVTDVSLARSYDIRVQAETKSAEFKQKQLIASAFKSGRLLWRLDQSQTFEPEMTGSLTWTEGSVASSDFGSEQVDIHLSGGNQGQPPPMLEEIIVQDQHPYRLDPRNLAGVLSTQLGSIKTVIGKFGAYKITATYDEDYGGMLASYLVERVEDKPEMSTLPDYEKYVFGEPNMYDGRWNPMDVKVSSKDVETHYQVEALSFTSAPGLVKPDWTKGKSTIVDHRRTPPSTITIKDLKRRFLGNWPPALQDILDFKP